MAHNYRFKYWQGRSMPKASLEATDDEHFWGVVLPAWEREKGFEHVHGSVTACPVSEYRKVPELAKQEPTAFLGAAQDIPEPSKECKPFRIRPYEAARDLLKV